MFSPQIHNTLSYLGAIIFFHLPLPFSFPSLPCILWCLHFLRRTLETQYLFKFSPHPIPPLDSILEFSYYWLFSYLISKSVYNSPPPPITYSLILPLTLWSLSECLNHICHRILSSVPRFGIKVRPRCSFFNYVSCPHYLFEIIGWCSFYALSGYPVWGLTFLFTGGIIMTCWAIERHEEYEIGEGKKGKVGGVRATPIFPGVDLRPPRFLVDSLRRK